MRGEVSLGKTRWLPEHPAVNVQGPANSDHRKPTRRMGGPGPAVMADVKSALRIVSGLSIPAKSPPRSSLMRLTPQSSKQGKQHVWTRKHINMLGTIPDAAVARKLDLAVSTVLKKRQKLGIPASRPPKSIDWNRDMIATLGRIPDREFARTYGMNVLTVYKKRLDLGIRCYARKSKTWHYWTKKEIALLGKMPDGEVGRRTGINKASVAWKRGKLNIPPFTTKRPNKLLTDWTLKEIGVLGTMTDAAAAATLDLAPSAVRLKRISLGIPPFGRSSSK